MQELFLAVGLVFVIEGLVYALFPNAAKNVAAHVLSLPVPKMRNFGVIAVAIGVFLIWLVKG